jgi:hypothetical protein
MTIRAYDESVPANGVDPGALLEELRAEFGTARVGSVSGPTSLRPAGSQIEVVFSPDLSGGELATAAGIYAAHDATKAPSVSAPALPLSVTLPANAWASVASWTLQEGQTCTFDLVLRGKIGTGASLTAVRVTAEGCGQRRAGEDASRDNPDVRVSADTLELRLRHRTGGTLTIGAESRLQVEVL